VGNAVIQKHPALAVTHGYQPHDFGTIVAAACLAHDIGNPPFGHSGEQAIGDFFNSGAGADLISTLTQAQQQDLIRFEGNANGFRIISEDREGVPGGLRLSYATLGTFTKYPKASIPIQPTKKVSDKKFGFFQAQSAFFSEVAEELGLQGSQNSFHRHPLAFLVEAADDICYTLIDFEDGINLGWIPESYALEYLIKLVKDHIDTDKYKQLQTTTDRLAYLRALSIGVLIRGWHTHFYGK
jgi:dGTPase